MLKRDLDTKKLFKSDRCADQDSSSVWSHHSAIQYGVDQSFIMWDVDSLDWKTHTTAILNEVKKRSQTGSDYYA